MGKNSEKNKQAYSIIWNWRVLVRIKQMRWKRRCLESPLSKMVFLNKEAHWKQKFAPTMKKKSFFFIADAMQFQTPRFNNSWLNHTIYHILL